MNQHQKAQVKLLLGLNHQHNLTAAKERAEAERIEAERQGSLFA